MKTVKFLMIFELSEPNFFVFLTLFDILIYASISLVLYYMLDKIELFMVLSIALMISIFNIILAIIALASFLFNEKQYNYFLHHMYNWIRMTSALLLLCLGLYLIIWIVVLDKTKFYAKAALIRSMLIGLFLTSAVLIGININWSLTFRQILIENETTENDKEASPDSSKAGENVILN